MFQNMETTIIVLGVALVLVLIVIILLLRSEGREAQTGFPANAPLPPYGPDAPSMDARMTMDEDDEWDGQQTVDLEKALIEQEASIGSQDTPSRRAPLNRPAKSVHDRSLAPLSRRSGELFTETPSPRSIRKEALQLLDAGQAVPAIAEALSITRDEVELLQSLHQRKVENVVG